MKKWILGFLILFFGFIFSLKLQSDSVPNIFIIEAVVIAIAYFLQIVVRIIVVFNIKFFYQKINYISSISLTLVVKCCRIVS